VIAVDQFGKSSKINSLQNFSNLHDTNGENVKTHFQIVRFQDTGKNNTVLKILHRFLEGISKPMLGEF
jgi:hypothetical protein